MTAFASVLGAIVAALSAQPRIAHVIESNPRRNVNESLPTCIAVHLGKTQPDDRRTLGVMRWKTHITVECYARGGVDGLIDRAWSRLLGPDAQISAAGHVGIEGIELIGIDWDYDELGSDLACAALQLLVQHRTLPTSLNSWTPY